ncbi:MAG: histidine kinase dimerization/phosphoacceptor domain -containing protein [Polaribacter sp.]
MSKIKLLLTFIFFSFLFITTSNAQLPVENYFQVDEDYVVKDSSVYEFNLDSYSSIELYKNSAKNYLKNLDPIKDSQKKLAAYHYIINTYKDLNQRDSALVYLYKALDLPNVKESKGAINIYWEIFRIYSYSENYIAQLEQIEFLQKLGSKYDYFKDTQPKNLQKAYGDVLLTAGYYKEASEYYKKFLINDPLAFDPLRYAVVANDLASIHINLNEPDSVKKYRTIALKSLNSSRKSTFDEAYTTYITDYIKLQDIWYKNQFTSNNLEFAKKFLLNASKNFDGETHTAIYANYFITTYYFKIEKYKIALDYINDALALAYKKTTLRKLQDLYFLKSRILDKLDKEDLALQNINQYKIIKADKLTKNRVIDLAKYEVGKIKKEKNDAEELAKINVIKRKNITNILIFISIVLLVITTGFIITREKNRKIKIAQNDVKAKLAEKEFLLKELNHRVKNNLSLILSLVKFQYNEVNEPFYKEKFISLEHRINTVAKANEQMLYDEDNLEGKNYNIKKYLINIANALKNISSREVEITITTPETKLNIDTVLPIGIMINELISNSIKHAVFKDTLFIEVQISLQQSNISIIYKDSGTKFIEISNKKSLGISIINSMVKQLKGTIERKNSEYTISLQLKNTTKQ